MKIDSRWLSAFVQHPIQMLFMIRLMRTRYLVRTGKHSAKTFHYSHIVLTDADLQEE
jgi:hypothetical protein